MTSLPKSASPSPYAQVNPEFAVIADLTKKVTTVKATRIAKQKRFVQKLQTNRSRIGRSRVVIRAPLVNIRS